MAASGFSRLSDPAGLPQSPAHKDRPPTAAEFRAWKAGFQHCAKRRLSEVKAAALGEEGTNLGIRKVPLAAKPSLWLFWQEGRWGRSVAVTGCVTRGTASTENHSLAYYIENLERGRAEG